MTDSERWLPVVGCTGSRSWPSRLSRLLSDRTRCDARRALDPAWILTIVPTRAIMCHMTAPKLLPHCERKGCRRRVKRRSNRHCSIACSQQARPRPKMEQPSKVCVVCRGTFEKPAKLDHKRWEAREVCSALCAYEHRTGVPRPSKPRQAPQPRTTQTELQMDPEPVVVPPPVRLNGMGRDVRPQVAV